ncbi:MAG: pantetheine-phosphate adenylyltransferase [Epsilonproteobacteria bacterium]|nr:MAG: pantetheine-phosphate adenylyltransferase [Campylobacterota bacterium]
MTKALYSGTFDPITIGHIDIIETSLSVFDEVVVAVAVSRTKKPMFDIKDRVKLVENSLKRLPKIKVVAFDNLLVDLAYSLHIKHVIRGLRAVSDFEYEFQMGYANSSLNKNIRTVFFMPKVQNAFISSSIIRELIRFGGKFEHLVPKEISKDIYEIYHNRGN